MSSPKSGLVRASLLGLAALTASAAWAEEEPLFPPSLLSEYPAWQSVTADGKAFESEGHGGILVRVFFNGTARSTYDAPASDPVLFEEGAIVAKARVRSHSDPTSAATRVYFMRKMGPDYDPGNGNWAYGFADLKGGKYVFNPSQGPVPSCIQCHSAERDWDYVRTVERYRNPPN